MERVKVIPASITESGITTSASDEDIAQQVMGGTLIILKGVFPADDARRLRDLAFAWGRKQKPSTQDSFYSMKMANHFCIERGVSKMQKTLHYYHSHNFSGFSDGLPEELRELIGKFCFPLRGFYNRVTGHASNFSGEQSLHPQLIFYPSGAGLFARHTHSLEPQRIGTITMLSKPGEDFLSGGAGFDVEGDAVNIESFHDIGDVALFRFDLPHWVSPIDLEDALDHDSPKGRWTLTMSYY